MSQIENTRNAMPPRSGSSKSPYTIWLLVLAFAAPVVLAYIMYFFVDIKSFTNHGEILKPVVFIKDFQLKDNQGNLLTQKQLTTKWQLISFVGRQCDQACQSRLHDVRQIYISLGKERGRVVRMLIHLETPSTTLQALINTHYKTVVQVYGNAQHIEKVLGEKAQIRNNVTYIMDPLGNVMMRFTSDQPDKDFLTDLRKLLKVSQIG